jgi:ATPase subunit of ABC transporter with duplicated ATPase domains
VIASRPFRLLILDEPTNNIDMETCSHLIEVLNNYKGALVVISHDENFLRKIKVDSEYPVDT